MSSSSRHRVAVVGATGIAGQQFLATLEDHPWFDVVALAASARSAGKPYRRAISDSQGALRWGCEEPLPPRFAEMPVVDAAKLDVAGVDLVFSAVESGAARRLEEGFAPRVPVISTSSAFRYEDDVPVLVPGVNGDHAALVKRQQRERGWRGFVVPLPNCTTIGLVSALAPLAREFGLVIPFIPKEEDKVQRETAKILGRFEGERIIPLELPVSATCTRVNVRDGHTEVVNVGLGRAASLEEIAAVLRSAGREFTDLGLPSSPPELVQVSDDPFRPQPVIDRRVNDGMTTVVGRLRTDAVLENGVKFVLLSHNTKMGAAKGAVLTAEYLIHQGLA
jgi:aspartate-semialdehyde dehydrogenase